MFSNLLLSTDALRSIEVN